MHDKRYSVFISSTFEDLKAERQAVQDVIISAGDFPVQMESFPAADEGQFEFIKSLIDECDYYVLIVAGRYGAVADEGISYTEQEYNHAISKGIPVLVMLHGDRGSIPVNKSEDSQEGKRRLNAFIATVEKNRLRKNWTTTDALKLAVREALDHAKATKPAVGWVRGDTTASLEALEELNQIRKENLRFRDEIGSLEIELELPPIPAMDDPITIDLLPNIGRQGYVSTNESTATVQTTRIGAFPVFYSNLKWDTSHWTTESSYYIEEEESCVEIGSAIAGLVKPADTSGAYKISKSCLDRFISYFIEAKLANATGAEHVFTEKAQRVARRYSIAGGSLSAFKLISGNIGSTSAMPSEKELDDEIPF
ncbi:DUF4062 domain-containing protein [Jannaschia rubra]|uniref:DUF4062 domain-containing protein n=1 Tax=Jannaschia rubra TaxID=282197 RepID=UPI0024903F86|nr:DUF4062 domain-containing protein [Jannaschia rubra]